MAMDASHPAAVRPLSPGMRRLLLVASGLVLAVGTSLFLLTEHTDRYFAWTITNPLTAAFLGAGYWASFVLEFLASRQRTWARARVAVPAVLVFTVVTLLVTLLHRDRFHFDSPRLLTTVGTWVWLGVYALVPPAMVVVLLRQLQLPGGDPPGRAPIPAALRLVMVGQAVVMGALGTALMVAPTTTARLWPWTLTELTGRAVGAWLLGLSVAAAQLAFENDWWRMEVGVVGYVALGALELLALARYSGEMDWTNPGAWLYLLVLVSFLAVGSYGWRACRQVSGSRSLTEGAAPHPDSS
jgi:hypothetical protein